MYFSCSRINNFTIFTTVSMIIPCWSKFFLIRLFNPIRLLSTIDVNIEFVPLSTSVFLRHKCQLSIVSDKIINNSDNFRIKSLSFSGKKCNFTCYLFSVFTLFYLILKNMSNNVGKFRFLCYIWHLWRLDN